MQMRAGVQEDSELPMDVHLDKSKARLFALGGFEHDALKALARSPQASQT